MLIPSCILRERLAGIHWISLLTKDAEMADQCSESASLQEKP